MAKTLQKEKSTVSETLEQSRIHIHEGNFQGSLDLLNGVTAIVKTGKGYFSLAIEALKVYTLIDGFSGKGQYVRKSKKLIAKIQANYAKLSVDAKMSFLLECTRFEILHSHFGAAEKYLARAKRLKSRVSENSRQAHELRVSAYDFHKGALRNSLEKLEALIKEQVEDTSLKLEVLILLCRVNIRLHDMKKTYVYAKQSLSLSKKLKSKYGQAFSKKAIAIYFATEAINSTKGAGAKYKKSLQLMHEAEGEFYAIGHLLEIRAIKMNIALIFQNLRNYEEALEAYYELERELKEHDPHKMLSALYFNMATLLERMDKLLSAKDFAKKAVRYTEKYGFHELRARALDLLAEVYRSLKDYPRALKIAKKAEKIFKPLERSFGRENNQLTLAEIYFELGDIDRSFEYARASYDHVEKHLENLSFYRYNRILSKCYESVGDMSQALRYMKLVLEGQSLLHREFVGKFAIVAEIKREIRAKEAEMAILMQQHKEEQQDMETLVQELRLRALRVQMNPHFIFNSLNSIQHFILDKDHKSAMNYLSKFAKLIRLIFDQSNQQFVSLDDELELLNLYLKLEHLRFGDKIKIELDVDKTLDKRSIKLPPLLIQPIIENAFKHGLMHKETGGKLKISFKKEKEMLRCTVADNGVGREKAKSLGGWRKRSETSSGLSTTQHRLSILDEMKQGSGKKKYRLKIEDLKSKSGEAKGTRVNIWIDLEKVANAG